MSARSTCTAFQFHCASQKPSSASAAGTPTCTGHILKAPHSHELLSVLCFYGVEGAACVSQMHAKICLNHFENACSKMPHFSNTVRINCYILQSSFCGFVNTDRLELFSPRIGDTLALRNSYNLRQTDVKSSPGSTSLVCDSSGAISSDVICNVEPFYKNMLVLCSCTQKRLHPLLHSQT